MNINSLYQKHINYVVVFISVLFVVISGCNTHRYRYISTHNIETPRIHISDSIKSIAIAYKIPLFELQQNAFPESRKQIAEQFIAGVHQRLSNSHDFDRIELLNKPVITLHSPNVFAPLNSEKINQICSTTHTDALVVLEYFELYHIYQEEHTLDYTLHTQNKTLWRIYIRGSKCIADEYFFRDTTTFTGRPTQNKTAIDHLPDKHYAFSFSAYRSGMNYGKRITHYKRNVKRLLYTGINKDFKTAFNHAIENEWSKAIGIWNKYTQHQNKTVSAKALYNISIAYESLGNLDKSLEIANKSYQTQTLPHTYIHIHYLKKKQKVEKL